MYVPMTLRVGTASDAQVVMCLPITTDIKLPCTNCDIFDRELNNNISTSLWGCMLRCVLENNTNLRIYIYKP